MCFTGLTDRLRITFKDRRCIWCPEKILAGEPARYRVYKFDGDFQTDYMHPECGAAMDALPRGELCEGFEASSYKRGTSTPREYNDE